MQKNKKAIIFGTGSIAELAYFYLTNDSEYEVVAFTADKEYIEEETFFGLPLVAFDNIESSYGTESYDMFIALSYAKLNKIREKKYNEAKEKGYKLLSYISTKATNFSDEIGDNCFILEDNTIQPYVKIHNNVTLWSGNHIGHHSIIESNNFISSHVVISGHCHIKSYSFLGVNSTIRDGITIESENIIGAGSLILKNTKEKEVYAAKKTDVFPRSSDRMKL